jgi:hypothetical protein
VLAAVDDAEPPVLPFDESGQAFNPVAIIAIKNSIDMPHFGVVNMAADHAIDAASSGFASNGTLEIAYIADRPLDF